MRVRTLSILALAGALALTACGDDDDDSAATTALPAATTAPVESTVETTPATTPATAPVETTGSSATPAAGAYVAGADPEADAVALAWTTAFDSATDFPDKAAYIVDADALRATIEAYTPAGEAVGGIALVPTAIVITGDTAAVTYDVMFAGQPAYEDQEGTVERNGDAWIVPREEFCGFMASARNPCP